MTERAKYLSIRLQHSVSKIRGISKRTTSEKPVEDPIMNKLQFFLLGMIFIDTAELPQWNITANDVCVLAV